MGKIQAQNGQRTRWFMPAVDGLGFTDNCT